MKFKINRTPHGSILVVTMCTAGIIMLGLATYLWLVSNHNLSTMRSLAWNSALTVAEAGAEEALTQTQYCDLSHLSNNSWTNLNNGWFYKKRYVDSVSYYEVMIKQAEPPVIISTATVPAPVSTLVPSANYGLILGAATPATAVVKRRIQVNTRRRPLFMGAMVADESVNLNGKGIATDGFDSTDMYYSELGMWSNLKPKKASGDISCNSNASKAVDVGNSSIMGHVATGPGGVANVGNAVIGDVNWVQTHATGVESKDWITDDAHFDISPLQNPMAPAGWSTGYAASVLGTNFLGVLGQSTYYKLGAFGGKVLITGDVTLWVTSSIAFGSGDSITLAPGSTLKLYMGDQSGPAVTASLSGIGNPGFAANFQYYGLPSNSAITFSANAMFTGTIYAPSADFKLNGGGGQSDLDFVGACVVKTATMGGHFKFHYDESLPRILWHGYVARDWNELDPYAPIN